MACGSDPGGCSIQLLDAMQQAVSALGLVALLVLITTLPPNNKRPNKALTAATLGGLAVLGLATFAVSSRAPCSPSAIGLGQALSVVAGIVVTGAFAPQVAETVRTRGRGSISYVYYLIQAVGCMLVICFQLFGLHDPWAVWAPTAAATCMQGSVVVLGVYYRGRYCCLSDPSEGVGTAAAAATGTMDPSLDESAHGAMVTSERLSAALLDGAATSDAPVKR